MVNFGLVWNGELAETAAAPIWSSAVTNVKSKDSPLPLMKSKSNVGQIYRLTTNEFFFILL
uniref:Uncharacterized protein n=1 Tax=Romanomermis culicivorax TaxID=13658 RepID=A0A915JZT9_ROMCU